MFNKPLPKFPKFRPMPDIGIIARQPRYFCAGEASLTYVAAINRRADAIVYWLYGPSPVTPHGFYNPNGFVAASQRNAKRNAIYRNLVARIIERDVSRGRAVMRQTVAGECVVLPAERAA